MAKLNETDILALLTGAVDLIAQIAALVPSIAQAIDDASAGLAETDSAALNERIAATHGEIQTLSAQLEALRNA
jgi:hypothetical protein